MASRKYSSLTDFDAVIPTLSIGKLTKFSRYDPKTKQRIESDNGRKVDLKMADESAICLQPVTLENPLPAPFGTSMILDDNGNEKWNITVNPPKDSDVFAVLSRFDERILAEGKAHPEWFREAGWKGKQLTEANIEANFGCTLKEPEPDKKTGEIKYPDYQWKMAFIPGKLSVVVRDDATGKYKFHEKDGHKHIHKVKCDIVPMCTPAYIWLTGNQWGVKWYINKVVVPRVHSRAANTDLSDMLGMEGLEVEVVSEAAPEEGAAEPSTGGKRKASEGADDEPEAKRPTMAAPSQDDIEKMFMAS